MARFNMKIRSFYYMSHICQTKMNCFVSVYIFRIDITKNNHIFISKVKYDVLFYFPEFKFGHISFVVVWFLLIFKFTEDQQLKYP